VNGIRGSLVPKAMRLVDLAAAMMAGGGIPLKVEGRRQAGGLPVPSPEALIREHFATHSELSHVNFASFKQAISALNGRPCWIVETGSSAWGTDSSRLFDSYVATFGGRFWSVDVRLEPMLKLRKHISKSSSMSCDDSVRFLKRWIDRYSCHRIDLVYLDSWDLDISNPMPAAIHGLKEFLAVAPALRDGSLLLVDDTPASADWFPEALRASAEKYQATHGLVPGKGMLIDLCLRGRADVTKISHRYQVLYRF
jgi:hypothetical protein